MSEFEQYTAQETLAWAYRNYPSIAISTSFQAEGMVVIDMASRLVESPRVFTIDTGRLPAETHAMIDTVRHRYGIVVEVVRPDAGEVASMVERYGADLFYDGLPYRALCCEIRKVRPLGRKLATLDAWITGLRRGQSESRAEIAVVEQNTPVKINPLAGWSQTQVEAYVREHDVPMHHLYSRGYTSIGCAPCTRAIQPGEDERAGRWWWEQGSNKECGIHFSPEGKIERTVDILLREVTGA